MKREKDAVILLKKDEKIRLTEKLSKPETFMLEDWLMLHSVNLTEKNCREFKTKLNREILPEEIGIFKAIEKQFKSPTVAFILSILTGYVGGDRYYLNEYKMAITKTITLGCFLVMYVIDMISIRERVYEENYEKLLLAFGLIEKPFDANDLN